ncbi:MAG: hypothetical protein QG657_630 [Acidobacteriota bacterium]|nr:hypothetical protein [Acidobacteriota bacterium]
MLILFLGYFSPQAQAQIESCPTKYQALAVSKIVEGNPSGGVILFEIADLDTKCYKELRVYVHVMNDAYTTKPFTAGSNLQIKAYHAIGSGSWNYFSEQFPMKYTSEIYGLSLIPVIGEKTRIVVFGYNMPKVKLKVDVAAYLVK